METVSALLWPVQKIMVHPGYISQEWTCPWAIGLHTNRYRGGSEPWRLLGLMPPGTWVSHIQWLASFCSSDSISCTCSFLLCLSPGTEAYHERLDHYGGPLSGLFDSRLCCLHYYSHPFLATLVYSRFFPRTTFWTSPHSDTFSGFSGPTGQHLNHPPGKSSFSILCPHFFIHGLPHSTNICWRPTMYQALRWMLGNWSSIFPQGAYSPGCLK